MKKKKLHKKKVQRLIELGKTKGFLTYEEVNDLLPAEMVSSDEIDGLLDMLSGEQIEVVDRRDGQKAAAGEGTNKDGEQTPATSSATSAAAEEEQDLSYFSKTNDPVRMYLRKMGSVCLLTREG